MLGLWTSHFPEAIRKSDALLRAGVKHDLFGSQAPDPGHDERFDREPGEGRFFRVTCLDTEYSEASPEFVAKLREHNITRVINSGTFNSVLYSLPTEPSFSFDEFMEVRLSGSAFPSRQEILHMEDAMAEAAPEIARASLHDFLDNVGPDAGFYGPAGRRGLSEADVTTAIQLTREKVALFAEMESRGKRRGIERVSLSVVFAYDGCETPDLSTDPAFERWREAEPSPTEGPLLLVKLAHAQQSALDPPAIGPNTVIFANDCHFDGIVLDTKGLIFDREKTLELAAAFKMPIYGAD